MNITFLRNKDGSPRGLVYISPAGVAKTVSKDTPNWAKIEAAIRDNDEDALMNAISMKRSVENFGNTGKIQVRNGAVYYGGEKLFGEDVNRILSYLHGGFPTASMIKFLEARFVTCHLNPWFLFTVSWKTRGCPSPTTEPFWVTRAFVKISILSTPATSL